MNIDAGMVKRLRDACGAGMMDCKMALTEAQGDMEEAVKLLRKKGMASADKKASRAANEGMIDCYIHPGAKVGVLLEVNCETDFVARNPEFKAFVHDVAMHIAAASPAWVSRDDVPEEVKANEIEIYSEQAKQSGKPEAVIQKIAEGKLSKWYSEVVLLEQQFVKDPEKTIDALRRELVGKIGENVEITRFARFRVGDEVA
ncbi:MAG TPA: translation elongation factor Ts [Thermoleophilia bacterium]|nr:translation elongation factor Ts [Thermoleophilia bacterium]